MKISLEVSLGRFIWRVILGGDSWEVYREGRFVGSLNVGPGGGHKSFHFTEISARCQSFYHLFFGFLFTVPNPP